MSRQRSRIVRELHDEPHVEGSRITVRWIHERVEKRGVDPATVADRHDLAVADVYEALAYYHRHPEEMAEIRDRRAEVADEIREESDLRPPEE
jgi:uncharacterized protein (DUF433 family)